MRNNTINNFITEAKAALITPTSTCKFIDRGVQTWEQVTIKPALIFTCFADKVTGTFGPSVLRQLSLYAYIYTNSIISLHASITELESFLYNNYSLRKDLTLLDLEILEGKPNLTHTALQQSFSVLEFTHKYEVDK